MRGQSEGGGHAAGDQQDRLGAEGEADQPTTFPQHDEQAQQQAQPPPPQGAGQQDVEAGLSPLQAAERDYVELEEEYHTLRAAATTIQQRRELTMEYQPLLKEAHERLEKERAAQQQQQQQQQQQGEHEEVCWLKKDWWNIVIVALWGITTALFLAPRLDTEGARMVGKSS